MHTLNHLKLQLLNKALLEPTQNCFINRDVLQRFRGFGGVSFFFKTALYSAAICNCMWNCKAKLMISLSNISSYKCYISMWALLTVLNTDGLDCRSQHKLSLVYIIVSLNALFLLVAMYLLRGISIFLHDTWHGTTTQ